MNEYLKKEDLISKIMATYDNNPWILLTEKDTDLYHVVANKKALATIINEMPSADVRENIHGEWMMLTEEMNFYAYECSVCHKVCAYYSQENSKYNFCPNCGADMRGETE